MSDLRLRNDPGLRRWLAGLVVAVILAACGGSVGSPGSTAPDLEGSTWRATKIGDVSPVAEAAPTIRFEGGQAGGTTGCNTYGGAYRLAPDGSFGIDSMIMTEMACDGPRGNQERVVVAILQAADRLELVGDELRISGPQGSITFVQVGA